MDQMNGETKMKRGRTLEAALFIASMVLFVVCAWLYLKAEDTGYKNVQDNYGDLAVRVTQTEKKVDSLARDNTAFANETVSQIAILTDKMKHPPAMNIRMHEPIQVQIVSPNKSLLKRAGIK